MKLKTSVMTHRRRTVEKRHKFKALAKKCVLSHIETNGMHKPVQMFANV
jgi:hypothetical protein